jgi:hypothetical protein
MPSTPSGHVGGTPAGIFDRAPIIAPGSTGVLLPPKRPCTSSPGRKSACFDSTTSPTAARAHHVADLHRREIAGPILDPAALRRIEREMEHAHQHLAVAHRRHRRFAECEVALLHHAVRAAAAPTDSQSLISLVRGAHAQSSS